MKQQLAAAAICDHLRTALHNTCELFAQESKLVPVDHWSESVFRFWLVRELLRIEPRLDCRTEWNRVDLVIMSTDGAVAIEMKFFTTQPIADIDGNRLRWKGGPSKKNFGEFEEVVDKVHAAGRTPWAAHCRGIARGYLVLAYVDTDRDASAPTYDDYYGHLTAGHPVIAVESVKSGLRVAPDRTFSCKLLEIDIGRAT